jgi:serine/threonine protein kinase
MIMFIRFDALATLKEIHRRGIKHGDISLRNLAFDSQLGLSIFDFSHSEFMKPGSLKEKNLEDKYAYFESLLELP